MSDTVLRKFNFKPGINRNTTEYDAEGSYIDGDKIRFRFGKPEKIGGSVRETVEFASDPTRSLLTGTSRAIYTWSTLESKKMLVSGSEQKVELMSGNQIFDITPFRAGPTQYTDVLSTDSGSPEVTVTVVNHDTRIGDFVIFSDQQTAVGGITLDGEYAVSDVIDADTFVVTASTNAASTESLDGGTINIGFLLENGFKDNGNITGYGGGTYDTPGQGGDGYDRPRAGVGGAFLRQWSFDNWGEDLLACVNGGTIFQWDATNGEGVRLQVVNNAPTQNSFILVGQPYRHLISFGTELVSTGEFDPMVIRWPSQESLTDWTPTQNNTAGEYRLPLGNYIVGAVQSRSEILVFTDSTVYKMRYVGGNDTFLFDILASNATAMSQHCGTDINGIVYWIGVDGFYYYDGSVKRLPSTLDKYYFDQDGEGKIDFGQKEKTYCSTNIEFNEIIFLVPSANPEISRCITYNYLEGSWYDGTTTRTVWADQKVFQRPYAIGLDRRLYVQEVGKDEDGSPMFAYIRSAYFDLDDGEELLFVDKFVPDFKLFPNRTAALVLYFKKYPNAAELVKGPYYFNTNTNKINVRGRGRQMAIEYRVDALGADFTVGSPRLGIQPDGGR